MREVDFAAEVMPALQTPADRAYHYISGMIDLKQVRHGELLPKADDLAKRIGVNRNAVLEALSLLQKHGLVHVGVGRAGVRVAEQVGVNREARIAWVAEHREIIHQMTTFRSILEPGIMRLVAERGLSDELHAAAQRQNELYRDARTGQERQAADAEFHRLLVSSLESRIIERHSLLVRRWVAPAFDLIPWPPGRVVDSHTEHESLLRAIEAGAPEAAERECRTHITASADLIHSLLDTMDAPSSHEG